MPWGDSVLDTFLHLDWVMILFAVPFVGLLLLSVFRLDERALAPGRMAIHKRPAVRLDRNGEPLLCDPDGHTWSRMGRRK